jgi:hypothetical protein
MTIRTDASEMAFDQVQALFDAVKPAVDLFKPNVDPLEAIAHLSEQVTKTRHHDLV